MTAQNFVLDPEFLSLITDTLVTVGSQKKPYLYFSKIQVLPHLNGAFTSTGQGLFGLECYKALMVQILARDIIEADSDVPEIYRELWQQHIDLCASRGDDLTDAKATVYHFGWVPSENRIVGLEYKVGNDFASTRIPDGCWLLPDTVSEITVRNPDDLLRITQKQKEIDDALPVEQRAGIGGDFHHLYLSREGVNIKHVFRAGDFDEVFREMEEAFSKPAEINGNQKHKG